MPSSVGPGITDWVDFLPASPRVNRQSYLQLPAFNITAPAWKDASEIVNQFNFTASSPFLLISKVKKPTGANYLLCIRYRIGQTVYRYKFWNDGLFVPPGDNIPLYTNQIILPNFVIEVWSLNNPTIPLVNLSAITIITSQRMVQTDLRDDSSYALAVGTQIPYNGLQATINGIIQNQIPQDFLFHHDATLIPPPIPGDGLNGGVLTNWPDISGNSINLNTRGASLPVLGIGANSFPPDIRACVFFNGADMAMDYVNGVAPFITNKGIYPLSLYIAFQWPQRQTTHDFFFEITNIDNSNFFYLSGNNSTNQIGFTRKDAVTFNSDEAVGVIGASDAIAIGIRLPSDGSAGKFQYSWGNSADGVQLSTQLLILNSILQTWGKISLSSLVGGFTYTTMRVTEILCYNRILSDAEENSVQQYLQARWMGQNILGAFGPNTMAFPTASAWLDNPVPTPLTYINP